jgi:regulator of replication initiation timing
VEIVERVREENGEKPEEAVHKLQRLKKALVRARVALLTDGARQAPAALSQTLTQVAAEMKLWDESLEQIRGDFAALIAERDRWQIAHEKLRERLDHQPLEPRSQPDRKPQSAPISAARVRAASGESQDFSAIDRELERLNASMLRAFSSE